MIARWGFIALLAIAVTAALGGCDSGNGDTPDGDAGTTDGADGYDAGGDTGGDVGQDAGHDAGEDAGGDEETDAGGDGETPDGGDGGTIDGRPMSPLYGLILFNEVLIDGTAEGDPNGDGDTSHPFEDQFVELVNVGGDAIDMGGFTLIEEDFAEGSPRHSFLDGSTLPAGHALVIFGGGDAPAATATASFFTANAADPPGLSFGLHLSVPSDAVWLLDEQGGVVDRVCYGGTEADCTLPAADDASLTRSPDLTGDFTPHTEASGSQGAAFSPGTRLDGSPF